jgi:hypothetical protein
MRFEVLSVVMVFLAVTPSSPGGGYQHFQERITSDLQPSKWRSHILRNTGNTYKPTCRHNTHHNLTFLTWSKQEYRGFTEGSKPVVFNRGYAKTS